VLGTRDNRTSNHAYYQRQLCRRPVGHTDDRGPDRRLRRVSSAGPPDGTERSSPVPYWLVSEFTGHQPALVWTCATLVTSLTVLLMYSGDSVPSYGGLDGQGAVSELVVMSCYELCRRICIWFWRGWLGHSLRFQSESTHIAGEYSAAHATKGGDGAQPQTSNRLH
jgi:hypothetical protein